MTFRAHKRKNEEEKWTHRYIVTVQLEKTNRQYRINLSTPVKYVTLQLGLVLSAFYT